ncbi:MAG TPA: phytoene desaturase family protein [Candidatus Saccharimonadales bacterium]|nr:phytoene desaturase family protein [Candidatus Saccharimonadales bacterium]
MSKKIIIIGAGIGGLGLAALLAKRGYEIEVFEALDRAGGRAGLLKEKGFTFDTGPSWYLMPEVFERYFSFFGHSADELLNLQRLTPAYKVFYENNAPLTVTGDLKQDSEMFEGVEQGAGASLENYVQSAEQTYKIALQHFLYNDFTDKKTLAHPTILKNAHRLAYLATTTLNDYASKFVNSQPLQQILEYPMVFLGTSPFKAPAIYSLMSYLDFKQGVFYPKNGIYSLIAAIERLALQNGAKLNYNSPISEIIVEDKMAIGVRLKNGKIFNADLVVSNADLHFTETVALPKNSQSYPESYWQNREAGPSALLMYLGVKGDLPQLQHHNLFFTNEWRQNFDHIFNQKTWPKNASMYICKPTQTDRSLAPKNHENVFVLVPLPAKASNENIEKFADIYLGKIAKVVDVPDFKKRIVFKRLFGPGDFAAKFNAWNGTALGMAHTLGQSAIFRPSIKSKKLNNLFYVGGGTLPGIGLPMCLISAELVADRIAKEFA